MPTSHKTYTTTSHKRGFGMTEQNQFGFIMGIIIGIIITSLFLFLIAWIIECGVYLPLYQKSGICCFIGGMGVMYLLNKIDWSVGF